MEGRTFVAAVERRGDSDELLGASFAARRSGALERTYRAYATALFSVARHVLGSDDDAMDCVHDALLRLWRLPNGFRSERGQLRAYLIVCVRNEAIARSRAAARHRSIERRSALDDATQSAADFADPIELERLRDALDLLPPEQRRVLACAYEQHLTHVEIARALSVPLGTVKSRLKLAIRRLSAELTRPRRAGHDQKRTL